MREMMLKLQEAALKAIRESEDAESLEALRVRYLGKKGELTGILRQMGKLSAEERPQMGQLANQLRAELEASIEERRRELNEAKLARKMLQETVDVTLPGETPRLGHKHPMYNALDQIKDIFIALGFTIVDGPEVELSDYNFTKLNIDEGHPSREWTDTFYFDRESRVCLRTQTSPMQVHAMETQPLPIRMIAPGRVWRHDVGSEGYAEPRRRAPLRYRHGDALPPASFPLYRAELRDGHPVPQVRRQGLPDLQGRGLDRDPRRRHGPSEGACRLRHRPGCVFRLGLRHGARASCHG